MARGMSNLAALMLIFMALVPGNGVGVAEMFIHHQDNASAKIIPSPTRIFTTVEAR